jgi:hypothetical protein
MPNIKCVVTVTLIYALESIATRLVPIIELLLRWRFHTNDRGEHLSQGVPGPDLGILC